MKEEIVDNERAAQQKKSAVLEQAVLTRSPEEVSRVYEKLGYVENSARALGLACRFRGLEYVRALVGGGANFTNRQYYIEGSSYTYTIHYWLTPLEMNNILRCTHLMDKWDGCFTNTVIVGDRKLNVLPIEQRAEIVKYLCENCEQVCFDAGELLYYAIMSGCKRIISVLKESGAKFSEQRITALTEKGRSTAWQEFCNMSDSLGDGEYMDVIRSIFEETGGRRFHYTEAVYLGNYNEYREQFRLYKPEFFRFILEHFNQKQMNKSKIMKGAVDQNSVACLEICAENGWLDAPRKRDEMIRYASENGGTECQAWLLEFKNRTADFAAERERAERKMMRELNADPNSVTELKKIWGYEKREDGTLVITRYKGNNTEVEVPEKIGNGIVTEIGGWAFSPGAPRLREAQSDLRRSITRITLPETVRLIGDGAFYACQALVQINIPDGVTEIGMRAFGNCVQLCAVNLPTGLTKISEEAFWDCESLRGVDLPEGITEIGTCAFARCRSLDRVTIPHSVKVIRREAFCNCSALERIVVSEGVCEIRQRAFSGCVGLKTAVLPRSVQKIQNYTNIGQAPKAIFCDSADVVVTVEPKSYAEKYCKRNNIQYVNPAGQ